MIGNVIFWDVDTQRDFCNKDGALYVEGAEDIKPNLEKMTQYARLTGIRLLGSVDYHSLDDEEIVEEGADFKNTFPPHCMAGELGAEKIMETRSDTAHWIDYSENLSSEKIHDIVNSRFPIFFRKNDTDVFTNPNAELILSEIDPKKIIVYGVAADVCVKHAVEGLLERQYEVYVVEDAIKGVDKEKTANLIKEWKGKGATLRTTEDILQSKYTE